MLLTFFDRLMKTISFILSSLAAVLLGTSCQQQQRAYPLYWFEQADGSGAGATFTIVYKDRYYVRQPIFNLEHFEKFESFLETDGSYTVTLYLKPEYRNRLYLTTLNNQGKYLLPVVNGMAFTPILIDSPVNTGKLTIWGGLNGYDLKMISRKVEPVRPEIEEKRYKDKDPRPRPKMPVDTNIMRDPSGRAIPQIY